MTQVNMIHFRLDTLLVPKLKIVDLDLNNPEKQFPEPMSSCCGAVSKIGSWTFQLHSNGFYGLMVMLFTVILHFHLQLNSARQHAPHFINQ